MLALETKVLSTQYDHPKRFSVFKNKSVPNIIYCVIPSSGIYFSTVLAVLYYNKKVFHAVLGAYESG